MSNYLCFGDHVSFYCEETEGYVYSGESSSLHNGVFVHELQDRARPHQIGSPSSAKFLICTENRYKQSKKLRKFVSSGSRDDWEERAARLAAEAEAEDNMSEQRRQHGKKVRYGEIIQLKNIFTGKYLHVSSTETSRMDKDNMLIHLQNFNEKHALFRILPRYKVNAEGKNVQSYDQVIFESVKSPGLFFDVSASFQIDNFKRGSELNLGIRAAGFTVVKASRPHLNDGKQILKGGSAVRMFHKELEAYLVAAGLCNDVVTEDVHLRIRPVDQLIAKSLHPSTSGHCYWNVESEEGILSEAPICWGEQVRFMHLCTWQYLSITPDGDVKLCANAAHPSTVFRLHPVSTKLVQATDEVQNFSDARIEHVITGFWLHGLRDEEYKRKYVETIEECRSNTMQSLQWDGASLRKIGVSAEQMYNDAYTFQFVDDSLLSSFNFASGMVHFLLKFIYDRSKDEFLDAQKTHVIVTALAELKDFILDKQNAKIKKHQKLMRNLRIVDLLVCVLKFPLSEGNELGDGVHLEKVFKGAYEVLHAYLQGHSNKNALYFARNIGFFETQISIQQGAVGLSVAQILTGLFRDNRKIVDRISHEQIDILINQLYMVKSYRNLELLSVLCVCNDTGITDNQSYIAEHWLQNGGKGARFLTECDEKRVVHLSMDDGVSWMPLEHFLDESEDCSCEEDVLFYIHQLDLLAKLVYGRNMFAISVITEVASILTLDDALAVLQSTRLPDALRSKYCELIICLFVDVGDNYPIFDYAHITFFYKEVTISSKRDKRDGQLVFDYEQFINPMDNWITKAGVSTELVTKLPAMCNWILQYLTENRRMICSLVGRNMLTEQVLQLVHCLIKFGYYEYRDLTAIKQPLLDLLDGTSDLPFPADNGKGGYTKSSAIQVMLYQSSGRFSFSQGTTAICMAKYQGLEVLDLLLLLQFNMRLENFIGEFKQAESTSDLPDGSRNILSPLLSSDCDPLNEKSKKNLHKNIMKKMETIFKMPEFFNPETLTSIMLDLSNYKYDKMLYKSLSILNNLYSSKRKMFQMADRAIMLVTPHSCHVHRQIVCMMPVLRRHSNCKLTDGQADAVCQVFEKFAQFCVPDESELNRHRMNQNILIRHEILPLIFEVLSQKINTEMVEQYQGVRELMKASLRLLKALAHENPPIQMNIFDRLSDLLKIKTVESEVAIALKEIFLDNQNICMKVLPSQVEQLVELAADHRENVPEFLELLRSMVKVERLGLTLKRNQSYVMKYLMQRYNKIAYLFDEPKEVWERILTQKMERNAQLKYFLNLVYLLGSCAERGKRLILSSCQAIMSMDDLLWVISHEEIAVHCKTPFVQYFLWVYLKTSNSAVESGAGDLPHKSDLWKFVKQAVTCINEVVHYLADHHQLSLDEIERSEYKLLEFNSTIEDQATLRKFFYLFSDVIPSLQVFYSQHYLPEVDTYPKEKKITNELFHNLVKLFNNSISLIGTTTKSRVLITCIAAILPATSQPKSMVDDLENRLFIFKKFQQFHKNANDGPRAGGNYNGGDCTKPDDGQRVWKKSNDKRLADTDLAIKLQEESSNEGSTGYYTAEMELNAKLQTFASNCSIVYSGHNTVKAQLKLKSKQPYTDLHGDEELPLGDEFQEHLNCFIRRGKRKLVDRIQSIRRILDQLSMPTSRLKKVTNEAERLKQEDLDIRCIQLLRALIHNEVCRLPEDWEEHPNDHGKQLSVIRRLQSELNRMGAISIVLPHLTRPNNQLSKEVLAFISILFFNANAETQESMLKYFLSTREETFFAAICNRLQLSIHTIQERRSLKAQHRSREQEIMMDMQSSAALNSLNHRNVNLQLRRTPSKTTFFDNLRNAFSGKQRKEMEEQSEMALPDPHGVDSVDQLTALEAEKLPEVKDEGYIKLVLQVLGGMCDGQHTGMQNYLRTQPDNYKNFNILSKTAHFLNFLYGNIDKSNIELVIQLFETLNEFTVGNQMNRSVLVSCKIIDYINFILRGGGMADCDSYQVNRLKLCIGNLLLTLIEENAPEGLEVATEVKGTVDVVALHKCLTSCYDQVQSSNHAVRPEVREMLETTGFTYFRIVDRLADICDAGKRNHSGSVAVNDEVFNFYKKNTMSIEIVKDNCLQKISFRVKNKNVLREEVKERVIWSVDRSSASNKIRDLMDWKNDIIKDIYYQRKILSNPITTFLTKHWLLWNQMVILLSVVINIVMLATWSAQGSIGNVPPKTGVDANANETALDPSIYDWTPKVEGISEYKLLMYVLGGTHNVFSLLVLLVYFISNHPSLPPWPVFRGRLRSHRRSRRHGTAKQQALNDEPKVASKMEVHFFSVVTLYYLIFISLSIMGTIFQGYFFAFHLLNIVNNNQLLRGVIQAVTQNGKSLIWVGILGLIVFYIYALISFALLRSSFDPDNNLYCATLWQCSVTVIRYGLIGDLFETVIVNEEENTFLKFGLVVIYHLSFFIFVTMIGLNIIFGIIVDTFSELRDLKWMTEKDMRDVCFICSKGSYEFEHKGRGFEHHITQEHDIWAYMFFFIHLNDTRCNNYTALEMYVYRCLLRENYDFFPLNRALSLSTVDEDATDGKVDKLIDWAKILVEQKTAKQIERKHEKEKRKQQQWRDENLARILEIHNTRRASETEA